MPVDDELLWLSHTFLEVAGFSAACKPDQPVPHPPSCMKAPRHLVCAELEAPEKLVERALSAACLLLFSTTVLSFLALFPLTKNN